MKRVVTVWLLIALTASLATYTNPPTAHAETIYAPMDIFGSEFNPYADTQLPDIFTVFAASFSQGEAKLEGKNPYTLLMTGSGDMYAAVAYHADVAGLSENEKKDRINDYLNIGFCEFQGTDGRIVTVRQANPDDDRYEYVDGGCLIEITFFVDAADMEKYTNLVRDNFDTSALAPIAEYLNVETDYSECGINVNMHKNECRTTVVYYMNNAAEVQKDIIEHVQCNTWEWNGLQQASISHKMIESKLTFDDKGGAIQIEQMNTALNTPLRASAEAATSLTNLRFGFDEAGVCGVYEERWPHYISVAIHRPEWGDFPDGWNIEYMDIVNRYDLRITYQEEEDRYNISLQRDGAQCAYDYYPSKNEYGCESPDSVRGMVSDAFGTQGDDFLDQPLAYFAQFVQERFGMSINELYQLPQ